MRAYNNDTITYSLDISTVTSENSASLADRKLPVETSQLLNTSKDVFLNNFPIHKLKNVSSVSKNKIIHDLLPIHRNTYVLKHDDVSGSSFITSDLIKSQGISIDESKSRITVRFLIKKSKRFCGAIRFYLSKSVKLNNRKFKNVISSLKSTVRNTLKNNTPSSKTVKKITNTLISTLKVHQLPECLRFRGFSLTEINKRKKPREHYENKILSIYSSKKTNNETFINPIKKPEVHDAEEFKFAKPKMYECGYCQLRFYKMPVYLRHIRRHPEIIRCVNCDKAFLSLISKRRHQLQCHKKYFY